MRERPLRRKPYLSAGASRLTFACAGHPPPLILSPNTPAGFTWEGRSAPLGLSPPDGSHRPQAELQLTPNTAVMFYTDGLMELRHEPCDEGLARLAHEAEQARNLAPQQLIDTITTRMLTDQQAHDDICALCIKTNSPASLRTQ
jgi:serine/threonine-protein kinase RsbW